MMKSELRRYRLSQQHIQPRRLKVTTLPGAVRYDEEEDRYTAEDATSPVGEIEALQQLAQKTLKEEGQLTDESIKRIEREIRRRLVDIFNGYAGVRFNGVRDIVDGLDFSGLRIRHMRSVTKTAGRA
ncbi:MAG: hypothetical protein ACE5DQ_01655 [Candidatus Paceibacterota bacterium]